MNILSFLFLIATCNSLCSDIAHCNPTQTKQSTQIQDKKFEKFLGIFQPQSVTLNKGVQTALDTISTLNIDSTPSLDTDFQLVGLRIQLSTLLIFVKNKQSLDSVNTFCNDATLLSHQADYLYRSVNKTASLMVDFKNDLEKFKKNFNDFKLRYICDTLPPEPLPKTAIDKTNTLETVSSIPIPLSSHNARLPAPIPWPTFSQNNQNISDKPQNPVKPFSQRINAGSDYEIDEKSGTPFKKDPQKFRWIACAFIGLSILMAYYCYQYCYCEYPKT